MSEVVQPDLTRLPSAASPLPAIPLSKDSALGITVDVTGGLPKFTGVGLAKERQDEWKNILRGSILTSGYAWPMTCIVVECRRTYSWQDHYGNDDIVRSIATMIVRVSGQTIDQPIQVIRPTGSPLK